ncbi:hypothetical protein [Planktotalea sp.]|uniref:hypothetical protein n=1 Tax=Planktotalea sp. TaxID=2029877 RepID=UPI003D6B16D3
MSSLDALKVKKARLVKELEAERNKTRTKSGKIVSMREVSLEIGSNDSYYTHLINHPTSFPSSDRLEQIHRAFRRLQKLREIVVEMSESEFS